jgi:hypothetical protein
LPQEHLWFDTPIPPAAILNLSAIISLLTPALFHSHIICSTRLIQLLEIRPKPCLSQINN